MKGILPVKYLDHLFLLIYSVTIFLKTKISEIEFELAKSALEKFVHSTENLYGKEFMTYNVHTLLHVPYFVKRFGALWAWSTFPFEHYNGVLRKMFRNSQSVPQQICKSYFRIQSINSSFKSVFEDNQNCNGRARELTKNMLQKYSIRTKLCENIGTNLRLFGHPRIVQLSAIERLRVEETLEEEVLDTCHSFNRFIYKNVLFHGTDYKRLLKRNNSTVKLTDNSIILIKNIVIVETYETHLKKAIIFGEKLESSSEILYKVDNFSLHNYSSIVIHTNLISCALPSMISEKCVYINVNNNNPVCIPLVNNNERD